MSDQQEIIVSFGAIGSFRVIGQLPDNSFKVLRAIGSLREFHVRCIGMKPEDVPAVNDWLSSRSCDPIVTDPVELEARIATCRNFPAGLIYERLS